MNKGSFKQFIKGNTSHRIPKIMTLAVTSCVLVTMITIDASASNNPHKGDAQLRAYETLTSDFANGWFKSLGTNWDPAPTSAPSAPTGGGGGSSAPSTTTTTQPTVTTTTDPAPTTTTTNPPTTTTTTPAAPVTGSTPWPVGVADSAEASGDAPPAANAMSGYSLGQVVDFSNMSSLPSGWDAYSSPPSGDTGAQFGSAHDVVGSGILSLNTWQDPAYGDNWVTGGVCDCGFAPTYGAFFVRSRVTGAGPTNVELLWPQSNDWPPEVDFNETDGSASATTATVHWGSSNSQYHNSLNNVSMTQWHTWGVIWTPTSITYTVDGTVWATVSGNGAQIPNVPMHLALQQQTWCSASPVYACPSSPQSMQINWIAVYTPNS